MVSINLSDLVGSTVGIEGFGRSSSRARRSGSMTLSDRDSVLMFVSGRLEGGAVVEQDKASTGRTAVGV